VYDKIDKNCTRAASGSQRAEYIVMCSGRVFMVMELSGNRGGKNRVLAEEGSAGWQVGEGEKTTEKKTLQDDGQKKRGINRTRRRGVTESQPFYDRAGKSRRFLHFGAPRSAEGFVLEISDGKSLRGSL